MSNLQKLAQIQEALGAIQSKNPVDGLTAANLNSFNLDPAIPREDLLKLAPIQEGLNGALGGTGVDFSAINRISDCVKNIDDLIIDKLKRKAFDLLLTNAGGNGSTVAATAATISKLIRLVGNFVRIVEDAKERSLLDWLILAKNSGAAERVPLYKTIATIYGSSVKNINDILNNIDNVDICAMAGLGNSPRPSGTENAKPESLPDFGEVMKVDTGSIEKRQKYLDVISRIGFAITDTNDFISPGGNTNAAPNTFDPVLPQLQQFSRAVVNRYSDPAPGNFENLGPLFNSEIEKITSENSTTWSSAQREFFAAKAKETIDIVQTESHSLKDYKVLQTAPALVGQKVSTGITVYGDPSWDFTTFLDLAPSERAKRPDLIAKYGSRLQAGISSLQRQGYKPGTLKLSDTKNGAFGKLVNGQSCASARWPGGTKLQLRNPDGSIFDPAGINPSGIVTVVDYGPVSKKTWDRLDVYIEDGDAAQKYIAASSNVQVYLVELGTKTSKKYFDAQRKFA